ncbi:hypothetical protein HS088_TW18G00078 [Tripterygium wilfordii]|uniref:CLAVATA3/ESR (CLE)-related protein 5-like n=1 Tax=Tripterygium wilfordii TaxID=458696 RepID=A0A7J7CB50_TRIWF|nr:hypothetical protein HS088_TW18G00078 [Tripterygium wilfordii]
MAKSTAAGVLVLLLISLVILSMDTEARVLMKRNPDQGHHLLLELGYTKPKLEYYRRVSMDSNPLRVSPGGPDPEHHFPRPESP